MPLTVLELISDIGFVVSSFGNLLIAFTAISVHHRFWQEHKIDEKVFAEMKKEQRLGLLGIILLTIGFVMEMSYRVLA